MRKYRLLNKYQDGSVSLQDFDTRKLFHGSVIHEYTEPTEFILDMVEGGYIEEIMADIISNQARRGRPPSVKHTTD
jgi:hypothetical protein